MKLLLVSPHFPPHHLGGVEIYVKRLAESLTARGDRVDVACVERIDSDKSGFEVVTDHTDGYEVHRLYTNISTAPDVIKESYHSPAAERWLEQLIARTAPDLVHLHSGYLLGGAALAASRARGIPTVVTLHDFWFICAQVTLLHPSGAICSGPESPAKCAWCQATVKRRYRLADQLTGGFVGRKAVAVLQNKAVASLAGWTAPIQVLAERSRVLIDALTHADLILAPSRFLRSLMINAGLPADRIVVSRYGIDIPQAATHVASADGCFHVGYLGQLTPHKGVRTLVEALRHVINDTIRVHIYGDPSAHRRYADELKRAARSDPRIEFHGAYGHDHVYTILSRLDAIVVPSIWYENSPFVIQEAQAARVPVLASRLGGMRELVNDEEDGLLFEPHDARDLARQLQRLVNSPALVRKLRPDGASVRSTVDEMRELSGHYRRLVDKTTDLAPAGRQP